MSNKICGIYCIENKISGKKYIGQSVNIKKRWAGHKRKLNNNANETIALQDAWNSYGEDNFIFYIVEECPEELLDEREAHYIDLWKTKAGENGYNLTDGGSGSRNPTLETRKRMSDSHIGKMMGSDNPMYGKHLSDETKRKLSEALTGKTAGEKHPAYGKKLSEERRRQISESKKGKPTSKKGMKMSKEAKENMSKAKLGKTYPNYKKRNVSTSRYKGVYARNKQKTQWRSKASYCGKWADLGTYDSEEDAALAYNIKAIELWGNRAVLNEIIASPEMEERVKKIMNKCEERSRSRKNAKSKYKWVSKNNQGKWIAYPKLGDEKIYFGAFESEAEAAMVVNDALLEFYGPKAILNIIPQSEIDSLWSDCYDPTNSLP